MDDEARDMVSVLVRDHDEVKELFRQIEAALDGDDPEFMEVPGGRISTARKTAPTRPHPSAPDHPPMDKLLGPPMGLVDRIRDAMTGRETG